MTKRVSYLGIVRAPKSRVSGNLNVVLAIMDIKPLQRTWN